MNYTKTSDVVKGSNYDGPSPVVTTSQPVQKAFAELASYLDRLDEARFSLADGLIPILRQVPEANGHGSPRPCSESEVHDAVLEAICKVGFVTDHLIELKSRLTI